MCIRGGILENSLATVGGGIAKETHLRARVVLQQSPFSFGTLVHLELMSQVAALFRLETLTGSGMPVHLKMNSGVQLCLKIRLLNVSNAGLETCRYANLSEPKIVFRMQVPKKNKLGLYKAFTGVIQVIYLRLV